MGLPTRAEIVEKLSAWQEGALSAAELAAWAEARELDPQARTDVEDDAERDEALADLALLAVHLLTPEDVPALRALLEDTDVAAATSAWHRHREAIDLDARSRRLRKDPFYRPFCR